MLIDPRSGPGWRDERQTKRDENRGRQDESLAWRIIMRWERYGSYPPARRPGLKAKIGFAVLYRLQDDRVSDLKGTPCRPHCSHHKLQTNNHWPMTIDQQPNEFYSLSSNSFFTENAKSCKLGSLAPISKIVSPGSAYSSIFFAQSSRFSM